MRLKTPQPRLPGRPKRRPRIIAFSGSKGSGKDTAAAPYTQHQGNDFPATWDIQQINFADTLKRVCMETFGFTDEEVYSPALKEVPLTRWPYKTPREVLQNVAKLFRTMYDPTIWVRAWIRVIERSTADVIFVTDLRHQEELDALKRLGAIIIHIDRPEIEAARAEGLANKDPLWSDVSESMVDVLRNQADAVIYNTGTITDLHNRIANCLLNLGVMKDEVDANA